MGADKEYRSVERKVRNLVENNYEDFIKTFISIEKGITNHEALDNIYNEYMGSDSMSLLSDRFDENKENKEEKLSTLAMLKEFQKAVKQQDIKEKNNKGMDR